MADKEETHTPERLEETKEASRAAEGEEKPVREKLKNAAISSQRGSESPNLSDADVMQQDAAATGNSVTSNINGRSRPAKKRSLEDLKEVEPGIGNLDAPATPSSGTHQRKKTRELKEGKTADTIDEESGSDSQSMSNDAHDKNSSAEAPTQSDRASTPGSDSERKIPAGNESPRKKRSAEEMSELSSHKQKIPATEEAQIARKSLDETRPMLESNGNGVSSAAEGDQPSPKKKAGIGGFGGAVASSPFATFGAKTGEKKLSSFASTDKASPFGTFGSNAVKSSFASSTSTTVSGLAAAGSETSDGSTTAKIGFANASSPFGSSGGFGAVGSKLTSFASAKGDFTAPKPSGKLSSFASSAADFKPTGGKLGTFASPSGGDFGSSTKKARPFGAPEDNKTDDTESDNEDDDGSEHNEQAADETETKPEADLDKIQGPKVPPGEEDEETLFSNRAKLFLFIEGAWKERGTGMFKLNIHRDSDLYPQKEDYDDLLSPGPQSRDASNSTSTAKADLEAGTARKGSESKSADGNKTQARFIMRAIATHRIIINAPLFKNMIIGDPQNPSKAPTGKQLVFGVPEDGKMSQYLLKIGREDELTNLYQMIKIIQKKL